MDLKPRDIMTRAAFENAITVVVALGGSTNAVLHLIAMARTASVPLTIDDFQRVSNRTPLLADFRPSGRYVMEDLQRVGGTPAVIKLLLEAGLIDGDCLTVTGRTVRENLQDLPGLTPGQQIVRPLTNPLKATGHLQILKGNLAPQGIVKGDVVVIRYEGPKGGPGMPEMLTPTSAIVGAGLSKDVALITDGRFSGGSHGFIVGHVTPEAQDGGPIALVRDGDPIVIDAERNELSVTITDADLAARRAAWQTPPLRATRGVLARYVRTVSDASRGCVTDE
jgi:dihydroxy-acid dehydratase